MSISGLNASVEKYAVGKLWYWYLPLWLFGLYMFIELLRLDMVNQQLPLVWIVSYSFNFFMHEWAHIFTTWLPPVLTASAGSGSEILLGLVLVVMAFWQRSYFASMFCFLWFALACQSAGQYMADAVPQRLPLVSLGAALSGSSETKHDWNFVFGQLHLLSASASIGNAVRAIGMFAGLFGVCFAAWVLYKIARAPRWVASTDEIVLATAPSDKPKPVLRPMRDDGFTSLPFDDHEPQQPRAKPPARP